jgi:hypothetical protein
MTTDGYRNSYELASKADWEGNFTELVMSYGLALSDLPPDLPEDVYHAALRCIDAKDDFQLVQDYLTNALDHCPYPDSED